MAAFNDDEYEWIIRQWITVKGKRVYRPNGRPFRFKVRRK